MQAHAPVWLGQAEGRKGACVIKPRIQGACRRGWVGAAGDIGHSAAKARLRKDFPRKPRPGDIRRAGDVIDARLFRSVPQTRGRRYTSPGKISRARYYRNRESGQNAGAYEG